MYGLCADDLGSVRKAAQRAVERAAPWVGDDHSVGRRVLLRWELACARPARSGLGRASCLPAGGEQLTCFQASWSALPDFSPEGSVVATPAGRACVHISNCGSRSLRGAGVRPGAEKQQWWVRERRRQGVSQATRSKRTWPTGHLEYNRLRESVLALASEPAHPRHDDNNVSENGGGRRGDRSVRCGRSIAPAK